MTAPNSTDDNLDKILIDFGMNCYEAAKNIKDATPKDLKAHEVKAAIEAEVQRQVVAARKDELTKAIAYSNKIDTKYMQVRLAELTKSEQALQLGEQSDVL